MKRISLNDGWQLEGPVDGSPFTEISLPCQVHDILLEHGKIENPNIRGYNKDRWIGESVWTYRKNFRVGEQPERCNLKFEGIDTFADILLNGRWIGRNESAYMPLYLEDVPVKAQENLLEVVIYPPREVLEKLELSERYQDRIPEFCKARVFRSGFHEFSGPKPDLIRLGIYGNVTLERIGNAGFREVSMGVHVNSRLDQGTIQMDLAYCGDGEALSVRYEVYRLQDDQMSYASRQDTSADREEPQNLSEMEVRETQMKGRASQREVQPDNREKRREARLDGCGKRIETCLDGCGKRRETRLDGCEKRGETRLDGCEKWGEIWLDKWESCGMTSGPEKGKDIQVCCGEMQEAPEILKLVIDRPELWYPRTHGGQPLYRIVVELYAGEKLQDTYEKVFGFCRMEQRGTLNFHINNCPVRIWGANLAHADTMTGCYPKVKEKLYGLLDFAELGNFNCLRIWGESEILDDDFYEECDRRGILLWQDFYLGYNMYSEEPEMMDLCRREAELLVKRLKHHPSILLWCGGNEMYWSRDMQYPGEYCFGEPIFTEIFPEVCRRLDSERYYHCSSPSGGRFSNDPLEGDTHGYTHQWFVPGREYPVFLSENCRVSAPTLRTMKKMMTEEELWPEGYQNLSTRRDPLCWPPAWSSHNTNIGEEKTGPIEHYFEAENAQELIYRLGAAHSEYIKQQVERFRRGRPSWDVMGPRRTRGHILWKFNNNSNIISYGIVDYFNEPLMAFYALKRAYEPFQISFSVEDSIGVWAVNDTVRRQEGIVRISLLGLSDGKVLKAKSFAYACDPDESILLGTLDAFGQFTKNAVLIAEAFDSSGKPVAVNTDYTEIERRLKFPRDGRLEARIEGKELILMTDTFARSVELTGEEDGDEFGWIFEDNYFDLIPGIEKRVRIFGKHRSGRISIRPYYWDSGRDVVM